MLIGRPRFLLLGAFIFTLSFWSCSGSANEAQTEDANVATVATEVPDAKTEPTAPPPPVDTPEVIKPVVLEDWEHQYEKEIEIFERQEAENPSEKGGIVFTGSSSIRMWKTLEEDMAPLPAINRGFGGSTLRQVNAYAERIVFPLEPSLLVVYCGENDIAMASQTSEETVEDFEDFVALSRDRLPNTPIIFLSMKPSISRWSYWSQFEEGNAAIQKICEEAAHLTYVDVGEVMLGQDEQPRPEIFIKDNLHMNEVGYREWTQLIKPVVEAKYEEVR